MGNEESTTKKRNSNAGAESASKKRSVRGSVYRDYQPTLNTVKHPTSPVFKEENLVTNDQKHSSPHAQSKSRASVDSALSKYYHRPPTNNSKQPVSIVPVRQWSPVPNKEHLFPVLQKTPLPSDPVSFKMTANRFEKAPIMQLNYVAKPFDNTSIHTYGPGNITVLRRTSSQSVPNGNRWYDHDYRKNVQPLIVKYL